MEPFAEAYIACALWSSTDEEGNPLDANYNISTIAPECLQQMQADCANFEETNALLLERWYSECGESPQGAGHDFWLTRNCHGAGFWDRWTGGFQARIGQDLTEAAHAFGSCYLYVGDDGLLYIQ